MAGWIAWKLLLSKLKLKHITVPQLLVHCIATKEENVLSSLPCENLIAVFFFLFFKPRGCFVGEFRKLPDPQWEWIFQNPQDEFSDAWLWGRNKKTYPPKGRLHLHELGFLVWETSDKTQLWQSGRTWDRWAGEWQEGLWLKYCPLRTSALPRSPKTQFSLNSVI